MSEFQPDAPRPDTATVERFRSIVLPHLDAAYGFARYLTRDPVQAQDVAQEAMLRALRYFHSFRGEEARPWLLRIVRNTWIDLRKLLDIFELTPADLGDAGKVSVSIRKLAARLPAYITLKDVKKRWGHGQEDIFPVAQFEKLWGDMSSLPEVDCRYFVVPRARGQQLKDQAQLDGWLRDGSAAAVEALCEFAPGL